MELLGFFIAGIVGGVLGGMGMGGGTLLIPILTTFFGLDQKFSQTINLIAFVPMAVVALFVHAKNGLIKPKGSVWLAFFALIFSVGASFLEKFLSGNVQKKAFGLFLIVLSLWQVSRLQKSGNKSKNGTFAKKAHNKSDSVKS